MEIVLSIALQIGMLAGVAAAIAALINVGKWAGLVKDGDAGKWSAGLNLVAIAALVVLKLYRPDLDLAQLDVEIGAFASVIGLLLSYLMQIRSSVGAHDILSRAKIPVFGKSYTDDQWKAEQADWKADIAKRAAELAEE